MEPESSIGIMGGMFDPVHHGHLRTAVEALETLELDQVRFIPCGTPVHRLPPVASAQHRIAMLERAVEGMEKFLVDTRECRRQGPSWMVETLSAIKQENPASRLFLLLGMDAFNSLPSWHKWREIFSLAHVIVLARPGWNLDCEPELLCEYEQRMIHAPAVLKAEDQGGIFLLEQTPLMISSSQIRGEIRAGRSARYLLPQAVLGYIETHRLYSH